MNTGARLATVQIIVAVIVGVVVFCIAPELDTAAQQKDYADFFSTCAQVIAGLFVALAVEARVLVRGRFLAVATGASIAIAGMSAVAALSPGLEAWMYKWLFTFTAAGGTSALVAAVVLGIQTLEERLDATVAAEIEALARQMGTYQQRGG